MKIFTYLVIAVLIVVADMKFGLVRGALPTLQNNVGYMYQTGLGVEKNSRTAAEWYEKAAKSGNATAQFNLGYMLATGQIGRKDYAAAAKWYEAAAVQGQIYAMNNLGGLYADGKGLQKNLPHAYMWFSLAANHGNEPAAVEARRSLSIVERAMSSDQLIEAKHLREGWDRQNQTAPRFVDYCQGVRHGMALFGFPSMPVPTFLHCPDASSNA
jgi:TPR repeat protein